MYVALPAISCFDRNTRAAVFGVLDSRCDHKIFRIRLSGESLVRRTVRRKRAQSVCGDKAAGLSSLHTSDGRRLQAKPETGDPEFLVVVLGRNQSRADAQLGWVIRLVKLVETSRDRC